MKFFLCICLAIILVPVSSFSQAGPAKKTTVVPTGFTLKCNIIGLTKGTEVKIVNANTSAELATATVQVKNVMVKKNGKMVSIPQSFFLLKGHVDEPDLCMIAIGDLKPFNMYLENSNITITGNVNNMNAWVVKGSAAHNDFKLFESTFTPIASSLNAAASTINNTAPGANRDALMKTYTDLQQLIQAQVDTFIAKKTSSYVSPFVLLVMMNFNSDPFLAETRFNKLSPEVRTSYLGKVLEGQIADSKIGAVGTQALGFTQTDTSGTPVSLASFRGRYVLVDFWASWCGPCRQENPNVVNMYNKFKAKNFTVLGVSLDKPGEKSKWVAAIQNDGLTWTHVSDLQWWNNEVAKLYHVQGIPQNILVDPEGKIVGKNLRGPELEAKLCEILGCN